MLAHAHFLWACRPCFFGIWSRPVLLWNRTAGAKVCVTVSVITTIFSQKTLDVIQASLNFNCPSIISPVNDSTFYSIYDAYSRSLTNQSTVIFPFLDWLWAVKTVSSTVISRWQWLALSWRFIFGFWTLFVVRMAAKCLLALGMDVITHGGYYIWSLVSLS